ncbi:MAG: aspartate aminotransferase family protein [Bacillaceae bacterium]|nr:aspartate aminotransferase family protein [Bacillaceae bacterium]
MALKLKDDASELLLDRTRESSRLYQEACEVMPGGVTANIKYFDPYPILMKKAEGAILQDVDGNSYVDYLLSYGAMALGHGHYKVTEAVLKQIMNMGSTMFGTPHQFEIDLARKLIRLYRGIEKIRYTNSGTEATLLAIRMAMAYTSKYKIAKFEGHYHGGFEQVLVSINPDVSKAGSEDCPCPVPESAGICQDHLENTIVLPFNNLEATERILRAHADQLAAVIIEPVQAGFIPADPEFLQGLRQITTELGILLIFDEVKTGFRVSLGGAQEKYGVTPDLTTLGKVLGGGFPIGVVGGRADIMDISAPAGKGDLFDAGTSKRRSDDVLFHSGTYNGHPSILSAGLATIEVLEDDENFKQIEETTMTLRRGIEQLFDHYGVPGTTLGLGSIFNVVMSDKLVRNYRDIQKTNLNLRRELDYELLNLGVYTKPLNRYSVSLAHTQKEIDHTLNAYEVALNRVKRRGKL